MTCTHSRAFTFSHGYRTHTRTYFCSYCIITNLLCISYCSDLRASLRRNIQSLQLPFPDIFPSLPSAAAAFRQQ